MDVFKQRIRNRGLKGAAVFLFQRTRDRIDGGSRKR